MLQRIVQYAVMTVAIVALLIIGGLLDGGF